MTKEKETSRRGNVLRNLFSHLEQGVPREVTPKEKGLKLRVYSSCGNLFPDIVIDETLTQIDYQGNFYRFHLGQKGRAFAYCDGKSRRLMIVNPNTQNAYISVPADQFGSNAEVRIGWFD
ncbi:MAG: hypothetical protein WCI72_06210 [archaeon]